MIRALSSQHHIKEADADLICVESYKRCGDATEESDVYLLTRPNLRVNVH